MCPVGCMSEMRAVSGMYVHVLVCSARYLRQNFSLAQLGYATLQCLPPYHKG